MRNIIAIVETTLLKSAIAWCDETKFNQNSKTNLQDENQESIGYFYSYQIGEAHWDKVTTIDYFH